MSMTEKETGLPQKKSGLLERLTGKIKLITGLIVATTAAVLAIGPGIDAVKNLRGKLQPELPAATTPEAQGSCVRIDEVKSPEAIAYSDWDDSHISVTGRNDCNRELGLYVTFAHRVSAEPPRLMLRRPHDEDYPECTGAAAMGLPKCWDAQKPVAIGQGPWRWEAPLPPLSKIGETRSTEVLGVTWDVRDLDAPDKAPLATTSVRIKIVDDTGAR